jgi:PAS domain S-box-containing protein
MFLIPTGEAVIAISSFTNNILLTTREMNLLKRLTETGVRSSTDVFQKRTIILTNTISLTFLFAYILLLICRLVFFGKALDSQIFGTLFIFASPIIINHFGFAKTAQIFLAWSPVIGIYYNFITVLRSEQVITTTIYDALKIFLLGFSPIPFLILNTADKKLFFIGISFSVLGTVFADQIMDFFEVGPAFVNGVESEIRFNSLRTIISYIAVAGSCFTVRYIVDRTDSLNQKLIGELHQKNEIIRRQAESKLNLLNEELFRNLQELRKREIVLKRSQEIAKVGSWEYNFRDKSMYWSEEMYNIFGVDRGFDLKNPNLMNELFRESAFLVENAFLEIESKRISHDITLQSKTPLGYVKWVRLIGFPLIENDGVTAITGIVHDVTIFKEAEDKIRSNEKNYRSLFEQATDAIMITDFKGNFIDVNSSMCSMLGYTKEEFLSMNIANVIDPNEMKTNPPKLDKIRIGEQVFVERQLLRKNGSAVFVESNIKMIGDQRIVAIARDITSRKLAEIEKERVRYELNERVKELTTLYKAGQILQNDRKGIDQVLQELVTILPNGWQYPEIAAARISLGEVSFTTPSFGTYRHRQSNEFVTRNGMNGVIEVVYTKDRPTEDEGPFLSEERNLITMVSDMLRIHLNRRYETEALKRSEANQSATINNTNFFIWSVNRDYELISFNSPFRDFCKNVFGVEVALGIRLTDLFSADHEVRERWVARFNRALTGQAFKVSNMVAERNLEYSLNPIREEDRIIGVSVFGEDISDRVKHEKQMLAVNKQIGELRLMALRSVMNPHFIFNCLNSIQYYIMDNDKRNAVNYLSTFSKLIRSILNNSVATKVKLSEELDMLRHYINLESLRFENKFDSVINVDPEIDVEAVEMPSMLIQPYVENAILHGLYNKKEKGLLQISIRPQNKMLLVEIEDDGVGRKASALLAKTKLQEHKSMGTVLTEERLKLINAVSTSSVEIQDLEQEGRASGTRVRVWIKNE